MAARSTGASMVAIVAGLAGIIGWVVFGDGRTTALVAGTAMVVLQIMAASGSKGRK